MRRVFGSRSRRVVVAAAALVLPMAAGLTTVVAAGPAGAAPAPAPQVAGASIQKVEWITDRRVALWITSPSMGTPIQVQLLLAKNWNIRPEARFPALILLDGLRALDTESGWTRDAHVEPFFADKDVNVVLPIGGESSFYSNWAKQDRGHNYQWETFLTRELPPLLETQWRTTNVRGVEGLSMGGTAAMFLAARNPNFVRYAASYSGFLTTTTLGMPQAIQYAMLDAGGFDARNMWGPPSDAQWAEHDPYVQADKLENTSLYVSSGSGMTGPFDQAAGIPGVSTNLAGMGLEILSRLTSQNFATKLNKLAIPAQVVYRPSGTHSWPYWDFEMRQSWPQAATALNIDQSRPNCASGGAIGPVVAAARWIGDCLTPEYNVPGGVVQDYRSGRVFYSATAGTHPVAGAIGGEYQNLGGPGGLLGMPTGNDMAAPDGRGRYQSFERGVIYWTPQTGAHVVRGVIFDEWAREGFERGPIGYPVVDELETPNKEGAVQGFERGTLYFSPKTGARGVGGLIMGKYAAMGFEDSWLGFPKTNEQSLALGGKFNQFEGGNVYWSPLSGAWAVHNGPIMDAWGSQGFENGRLKFPTTDEFPIPGGVQQNFQLGYVTLVNGKAEVH